LTFVKTGFYTQQIPAILLVNNAQFILTTVSMSPTITSTGGARITLTWATSPKDMDIHLDFDVSSGYSCKVNFANRDCVMAILETDNRDGGSNVKKFFNI
jgi:hypothetical protein